MLGFKRYELDMLTAEEQQMIVAALKASARGIQNYTNGLEELMELNPPTSYHDDEKRSLQQLRQKAEDELALARRISFGTWKKES